jgi:hypothetical protein
MEGKTNMHTILQYKRRLGLLAALGVLLSAGLLAGSGLLNQAEAAYAPLRSIPSATCSTAGSGPVVRTCDLWAKTGSFSLPGTASPITIWGYTANEADPLVQPGGPTIYANAGEKLVINLHNGLSQNSSLYVPEQNMIPDRTGIGNGATAAYTVNSLTAGTFLYEAGLTPGGARQVAMGMYGALVVRPNGYDSTSNLIAYSGAPAYNEEAVLIFSEIDPAFNNSSDPATANLRNYNPKYWLINGAVDPNVNAVSSVAGHKVLLRYLNAGLHDHSIGTLGLRSVVLGNEGQALAHPYQIVAETLAAGQSLDLLTTLPSSAPLNTKYPLYNGALHLDNAGQRNGDGTIKVGGMLTFITVTDGPSGTGGPGPVTSNVAIVPGGTTDGTSALALSASATSAGFTVTAAEYYIDNTSGSSSPMAGSFGSATVSDLNASISTSTLGALAAGPHTVYVRAQDANSKWGAFASTTFNLDNAGPKITGLALNPGQTNGATGVDIAATADDTTTGNSNVTAAEYFIDSAGSNGSGTALSTNQTSPIVALTGTIPASTVNGLSEGSHTVKVHAQDSTGNWSDANAFSATLKVDKTGPTASANGSGLGISPNPSNGLISYDPQAAANGSGSLKLTARFTDTVTGGVNSNIVAAEGFIDTVGATGSGFVFLPSDGAFNSPTETAYVLIPLTALNALADGSHPVYVRGKDAAGNWGSTTTVNLIIDRHAPVVSNVALTANPPGSNFNFNLTATVTDAAPSGGIGRVEWFVGADPGQGNGNAMTLQSGNAYTAAVDLTTLPGGNLTFTVRAIDAAGNVSNLGTVNKTSPVVFANSFEEGNFSAWNAGGGNRPQNRSVTTGAALKGTYGMRVTVNGTQTSYVIDNSPANETRYNARFYFNPNGTNTGNSASTQQNIFQVMNTGGNTAIVVVQYQKVGTTYQVRAVVTRSGGTTATNWYTINNGQANAIEIGWQSGNSTSFNFWVNGTLRQTLTGLNTSAYRVDAAQLGAITGGTGFNGTEYFDAFVSTRGGVNIGL